MKKVKSRCWKVGRSWRKELSHTAKHEPELREHAQFEDGVAVDAMIVVDLARAVQWRKILFYFKKTYFT